MSLLLPEHFLPPPWRIAEFLAQTNGRKMEVYLPWHQIFQLVQAAGIGTLQVLLSANQDGIP